MQNSPYTPGRVTAHLPGREQQLKELERSLMFMTDDPGLDGRIKVYVGPRGVGKTSFLRAAQKLAENQGYSTVWVTAGDAVFLDSLLQEFARISRTWADSAKDSLMNLLDRISISFGGFAVGSAENTPSQRVRSHASLARQLQDVISLAGQQEKESGNGIVLLIDEVQEADADGLRALSYAWQHMQSESPDLPLMTLCAGLSHTQDVITDAVSFAERFEYTYFANLPEDAASEALVNPALKKGVKWHASVRKAALQRAGGYPYFLQLIGDEVWKAAGFPDAGGALLASDFAAAEERFQESQNNFYRARWKKATKREMDFLAAMAGHGTPYIKRATIAESMGVNTTNISELRRSLMDKGLIESPKHGFLTFTAPGFAEFIRSEYLLDDEYQ